MAIEKEMLQCGGVRFSIKKDGREVARAFLYILSNDLHKQPFGFMEDVFVDESQRGQGLGTQLVEQIVATAKEFGCYKIVATSRHERPRVHQLYERLSFKNYGIEFRMDWE